jgi:alpha-L-fucosidase
VNQKSAPAVPVPTAPQLRYQEAEIVALIHFNMATFVGEGGCSGGNWNQRAPGAAGPSSDPKTWNPDQLNTSQWADIIVALGAKGAVLTAKHDCGFLLWPSQSTLPDGSRWTYSVANAAVKTDVVKEFAASMTARRIGCVSACLTYNHCDGCRFDHAFGGS